MSRVVTIVGPTGTGKSRLALHLAKTFNGEIVNTDSRQVYRHMDIGTAKPTSEEIAAVPHHLFDIASPNEDFSLAQYQAMAYQAIEDIERRGKLPLMVGGSGLYVWAVVEGWEIPRVAPDPELRRRLEAKAAVAGKEALHRELVQIDPQAAERIDPRNLRRVIRAIEVAAGASAPLSRLKGKRPPPFQTLIIGLTAERQELYRRVDARVDEMVRQGLVGEVAKLLQMGYNLNLPALSGIGYRQIARYLNGGMTQAEAVQQIKTETHRFIRHQYMWFRLKDNRIRWFDIQDSGMEAAIDSLVAGFLSGEKDKKA
ncbi:MAG: tRNA (adenosine(37)-N6)-dimethylallyltransferase MiaA [Chloroflexi bacterium]|nr:tRNA (adenosine(37)-N6)-dimethylallyltransferase MiaA [Chloroflexota bacterium]